MPERGLVITGARARLSINGKKIGYCRNVSLEEVINFEPIRALDNIAVEEHVPLTYDVTMSAQIARLVGKPLTELGLWPKKGKNTSDLLFNILTSGDLTAVIEDTKTGKVLAAVENVRTSRRSYTIDAGAATFKDVQFVAILVRDESET